MVETLEFTDEFLAAKNAEFESADAETIVRWVFETFPDQVFMTSAWQRNGMVLIDLMHKFAPQTPVLFIDTGFHFPETLSYALEMTARYRLNLVVCKPEISKTEFEHRYGLKLHDREPDTCCAINKVAPLEREIARMNRKVWITGLRRDQSETRKTVKILEKRKDGILKVAPLVKWSSRDVWKYLKDRGIPEHPLYEKGYASIGCSPESCTVPAIPGEDERSGRWQGIGKKECGIHYQI